MSKQLYEDFHKDKFFQKRIIGENNFTYRNLIYLLKKYGKEKRKFLDIGSGVGTVDFYLASKEKSVVGIEISKKACSLATKNAKLFSLDKKTRFYNADFLQARIRQNFDLIVCSEVLEHLQDDKKALKKMSRLMEKNGVLIISVPSKNAPLYKLGMLRIFDKKVGHLRRYSEEELRRLIEITDLRVVSIEKFEGLFRNLLFTYSIGSFIVKVANKSSLFSDFLAFIDKITLFLFGESNIYLVARKL